MEIDGRAASLLVGQDSVLVPASVAGPIRRALESAADAARREGVPIRAEVAAVLAALRLAEQRYAARRAVASTSASGPLSAPQADLGAPSPSGIVCLLDPGEVARRLHVSARQVRRLRAQGHLPGVRLGNGYAYAAADVDAFIARRSA